MSVDEGGYCKHHCAAGCGRLANGVCYDGVLQHCCGICRDGIHGGHGIHCSCRDLSGTFFEEWLEDAKTQKKARAMKK